MGRNGIGGDWCFRTRSIQMIRDSDGLAHNEMFLYNDGKRMWAGTFGGGVSCFHDNTWFTLRI